MHFATSSENTILTEPIRNVHLLPLDEEPDVSPVTSRSEMRLSRLGEISR